MLGIDIPPLTHKIIAAYMDKNIYTGRSIREIETLSETLLPSYLQAVLDEGLPVFYLGESEGVPTMYRVIEITGLKKGLVVSYLASLQQMAQEGKIDTELWNPTLEAVKPQAVPPLEILKQIYGTIEEKVAAATGGFIGDTTRNILIVGGIVAVVYLLGREMISKPEKTRELFTS